MHSPVFCPRKNAVPLCELGATYRLNNLFLAFFRWAALIENLYYWGVYQASGKHNGSPLAVFEV